MLSAHWLFSKRLLVWDTFRCHLSKETKSVSAELRIHQAVVPGGCTKYVQARDVCWNQPFKAAIAQSHEDWMMNGEKELTRGGNLRPPPMEVYLQWVVDAWASLSSEIIASSFKTCGITNAVDDSENDRIHCFKPHGPIPEGLSVLSERAKAAVTATTQGGIEPEEEHEEDVAGEIITENAEIEEMSIAVTASSVLLLPVSYFKVAFAYLHCTISLLTSLSIL